METVGFIGLGNMGAPVAGHIQKAGYPMVVCDLSDKAAGPFVEQGARRARFPAETARWSDVVLSALPGPREVEEVWLGARGLLDGVKPGAVCVDISTSPPSLIQKMAPLFGAKKAFVLDAPVSAGQPGAARGIHEVMVGGDREVFERVRPILGAFGDQIIHAGGLGAGSICKLVHQLIGCGVAQAIAEGLTLGVKAGVRAEVVWECVRRGLVGRMHMLHEQIPRTTFQGRYEPAVFTLSLLRKDLGLATSLGREHGVPLPLSSMVEQILVEALNRGWGKRNGYTASFALQEEAAGVEVRASGVDPERAAKYISTHPEIA